MKYLEALYDCINSDAYKIWAGHSVHMDATSSRGVYFVVGKYSHEYPVPYTKREAEIIRSLAKGRMEQDTVNKLMADCLRLMDGEQLSNEAAYKAFLPIVDAYSVKQLQNLLKRSYNSMNSRSKKHCKPHRKASKAS